MRFIFVVSRPLRFCGFLLLLLLATGSLPAQETVPGSVVSWGYQLQATFEGHSARTPEGAQSGVTAIAATGGMAAAVKADGTLLFWEIVWPDELVTYSLPLRGEVRAIVGNRLYEGNFDPDEFAVLYADGSVEEFRSDISPPASEKPKDSYKSNVTAIAYAYRWLLAAKEDGTILVDGALDPFAPVIPGGAKALASTAYGDVALALRPDGTVSTWRLGTRGYVAPIPLNARSGVVAIAGGEDHFLALKADGSVVAWPGVEADGFSDLGQTRVPPDALSGVKAIDAGSFFSLALKTDGTVVEWGRGMGVIYPVVPAVQGTATAICASKGQVLALVAPRAPSVVIPPSSLSPRVNQEAALSVSASGPNLSFQWLRDGEEIPGATHAEYPLRFHLSGSFTVVVSNPYGSVTSSPPSIVTMLPATPGAVVAVGAGLVDRNSGFDEGQSIVPPEADGGVVAVAGGGWHSLALKADGSVIAWGGYTFAPSPFPAPARNDFVAVAAGWVHSLGLTRDGTVVAWGGNDLGQSSVPAGLAGQVVAIAADGYHSLALKRDGSVVAWGANNAGQRTVPGEAHSNVVAIAAGGFHSMALKADGSIISWGANGSGQRDVPNSARHGVIALAAGDSHSLALKEDGSVVAWGLNSTEGVLTGQIDVPPAAQAGVVAIAAGGNHSAALKADGTVVTWGHNAYGQNDVPELIQGAISGISAGSNHTLLILGTAALQSRLTAEGLMLSWPTNLPGFHLETTSSLDGTPVWLPVADAPVVIGNRQSITRPLNGEPRWYRLSR